MKTYEYRVFYDDGSIPATGHGYDDVLSAAEQAKHWLEQDGQATFAAVREEGSKRVVWSEGTAGDGVPDEWFKSSTSTSTLLWVAGGVAAASLAVAVAVIAARGR